MIILISDGEDTTSQMKFANAIDSVQRADAIVYAISNRISTEGSFGNARILKQYAESTGGRAFFSASLQDIKKAFDVIQQELQDQYILSYDSSNTAQDGSYRKAESTLNKASRIESANQEGVFCSKVSQPQLQYQKETSR